MTRSSCWRKPEGEWKVAGKLPRPLGYGVSGTHGTGVVCVGGSDAEGHRAECFRLEWRGGKLEANPLPPLPRPIANMSGALLGDTLYVAGGLEKPDSTRALKTCFALNLAAKQPAWSELEPWPGPARMLAVAAAQDGSFFLVSGTDLSPGPDGKPVRALPARWLPLHTGAGLETHRGLAARGRGRALARPDAGRGGLSRIERRRRGAAHHATDRAQRFPPLDFRLQHAHGPLD